MKNKNIRNAIIFIIVVILFVIFQYIRFNSREIDEKIYNKVWYKYNYNTGYYDTFEMNNSTVKYIKPSVSNEDDYSNCVNYYYNKKENSLILDCNKKIKILSVDNNSINLIVDNKSKIFFDSIDETTNHEFESYFGKSIIEYKKEKLQAKDFIKINENKLKEIINSDAYSKIVFIGNECTSVDCALALDVMEKWIATTEDVYYFDVNDLNDKLLKYLNNIDNNLVNNINYYDNIYPRIIISKKGKIIDNYEIKCKGFDCTNYYKNEF